MIWLPVIFLILGRMIYSAARDEWEQAQQMLPDCTDAHHGG